MGAPPVFGRYQVIEIVGSGPHGRILKVEDLQAGEVRALKVLLDDSGRASFFDDFQTFASIEHSNVVRLFDCGHDATGLSYFSMEMLRGQALSPQSMGEIPVGDGIEFLTQALSGIACLHLRGLVHGNVKPSNLFLAETEGVEKPRVILLDPGLSVDYSSVETTALAYLAPECLNGATHGIRSDLYSLGAVFYETLTGCFPFTSKSPEGLMRSKRSGVIAAPSTLRPEVPPAVDSLILRMLAPDPSDRPGSAEQALELLSKVQAVGIQQNVIDGAIRLPLVGRERILETIDTTVALMDNDGPKIVLLTGGPGAGKTRLLQEAKLRLRRQGVVVGHTRCYGGERRSLALGRLLNGLLTAGADGHEGIRDQYASSLRTYLSSELNARRAIRPLGTLDWRGRGTPHYLALADQLAALLCELGSEPVAVFIDDLHLAPDVLQRVMSQLRLRRDVGNLLVVGCLDPSELTENAPLHQLLDDRDVARHELTSLSVANVDSALGECLGNIDKVAWLVHELDQWTSNNPGRIQQLLESGVDAGGLTLTGDGWILNEALLTEAFQGQSLSHGRLSLIKMERMSTNERRVMQCIACLSPIEIGVLDGVIGASSTEDLPELLERLVAQELIVEQEPSQQFYVASEQLRHALVSETDFIERRHWNRRAVHILSRLDSGQEDYFQLASYALDSGEVLKTIAYGMSALDELEEHWEFEEALGLCDRLQSLSGLTVTQRFQLADRACRLALLVGDVEKAKFLGKLLAEGQGWEDSSHMKWRANWAVGRVSLFTGSYEDARVHLDTAISWVTDSANPAELIELKTACVLARMLTGRPEQAEQLADETLGELGAVTNVRVARVSIYLWALRTNLAWIQGNSEASEAHTNRGFQLAESFKLHFPEEAESIQADLSQLWLMRANACYYQGRYGDTIQSSSEALQHFESVGDLAFMGRCHYLMGLSNSMTGDYPAAIQNFEALLKLAKWAWSEADLCTASANLGVLYRMSGKLRLAQDILEEGLEVARRLKDQRMIGILLGHLGEVWHRREQFDKAKATYEQAVEVLQYTSKADLLENLTRLLELSFDQGLLHNFEMKVAESLTLARSLRRNQDEGNLLSLMGAYSARMGRFREAMGHYRSGEASLRTAGAHYDLGRLKLRQGHSYMDSGAIAEAETSLRAAEETFRRLGALPSARKAQETLRLLDETNQGNAQVHKKLQMLLEVTRSMNTVTDIEQLLDLVVDKAIHLTQSERGFILLFDEVGSPTLHSSRHIGLAEIEGAGAKLSNTVLQRIKETRKAVTVTNVDRDTELRSQKSVVSLGLRSLLAAPLNRGDKLLGVLYLDSSKPVEEFYRRDQSLLEALADAAAIAVENAQLVTSLRRKNELMAYLAHEFRSPVTATMLFTRQMLRRSAALNEEDRDALSGIVHQSERLSRMIDNILNLARMEARQVQIPMHVVSVLQVLDSTAQGLEPIAREVDVQIRTSVEGDGLHVWGSADRLVQVCTNLLANALKNVPASSTIHLVGRVVSRELDQSDNPVGARDGWRSSVKKLGWQVSEEHDVLFEVLDSGPGIPAADLQIIFERFAQAGEESQQAKGAGLGLSICREIVAEHHGVIWAENRPEGGAAFRLRLPLLKK